MSHRTYCNIAVAAGDVPRALVRVTVTESTAELLPFTVNGCESVNWLPKGAEVEVPYQVVKSGVSVVLTWVVCRFDPSDAENWNGPLSTPRLLAKPVTDTVNPVLVRAAVTLVITGAPA